MATTLSLLLGTLAMITMGIANAMGKIPSKRSGIEPFLFYRGIIICIIFGLVAWRLTDPSQYDLLFIAFALLLSAFFYFALAYLYKAVAIGKVGLVSPVTTLNVAISLTLTTILLKVPLSLPQILLIIMIIIGILVLSLDFKDFSASNIFDKSSGVPYAMITALLWGVLFFLVQFPIKHLGAYLTTFLLDFGILICAVVKNIFVAKDFRPHSVANSWKHIVGVAIFSAIGALAMYLGMQVANSAIVIAVSTASPLSAMLYGRIFYKEKLSPLQYGAIIIVILAIVALGLVA